MFREEGRAKAKRGRRSKERQVLDPSERVLVQGLAEGKSKVQAARDAGYSETTARSGHINEILSRPLVQSALTRAVESLHATLVDLVRPFVQGLKAERIGRVLVPVKGGKSKLRFGLVPDWQSRLAAGKFLVMLFGGIPKGGEETPAPGGLNLWLVVGPGQVMPVPWDTTPPPAGRQDTQGNGKD